MSREYTTEEIREKFIKHVLICIEEWDNYPKMNTTERLNGLAFSILAMIDGSCISLPSFILAPMPHEDDKQYCIDTGQNYYPQNNPDIVNSDIGGILHDVFSGMTKKGKVK